MKKAKKHIALFLAFLMSLSLFPGSVLAEAAEGTYTLLCEPNIVGGFENETYGNVAAVWEKIYYDPISGQIFEGVKSNKGKGAWEPMHLLAADKSGVHAVSDWYQKITGLSNSGFAAAQNFDGKWGVIKATGDVVVDFVYDDIRMPTDDGYALARNDKEKYVLLDLNVGNSIEVSTYGEFNDGFFRTSKKYISADGEELLPEAMVHNSMEFGNFNNGYAIVRKMNPETHEQVSMIIDKAGTVLYSDEKELYSIAAGAIVSSEGLVPIRSKFDSSERKYY